jgi:putative ATP-dependent endonuclease of OLD family
VIVVEGISDRIVLEHLADLTDRNLDRLGISLIEANGFGDMGPLDKLFGATGFGVPMSQLIDEDAEERVAKQLGVEVADLQDRSVWVSRSDLEAEYVRALGWENVWSALESNGQFSRNALANCAESGPGATRIESDVVDFCRRNRTYKVKAALSVLPVFTVATARSVASIESLLNEIDE